MYMDSEFPVLLLRNTIFKKSYLTQYYMDFHVLGHYKKPIQYNIQVKYYKNNLRKYWTVHVRFYQAVHISL